MVLIIYFLLFVTTLAEGQAQSYTYTKTQPNDFFEKIGWHSAKDVPLLNRKIFKGMRMAIREHPYVVSVRRMYSHYITGTLISYNTVLTVAHPIYGVSTEELGVVAGENYSDRGTSIGPVVLVVIHELFDPNTLNNDLAMLRVYENFPFMTNVKAIRLASAKAKLQGYQAFVTGWGRCDFTGKELCLPRSNRLYPREVLDPMLRTVTFTVNANNSYCSEYTAKQVPIRPGMMCLGNSRMEEPMMSCMAVPGAPLVVHGRLAGIQSWGLGCGYIIDLPLVYVDLSYYRRWINHNLLTLSRIPKDSLTKFHQATKAYIFEKWLNKTRPYLENRVRALYDYDLQLLDMDYILVNLLGDTYDLRDFIYDGMFQKQKLRLYINAKRSLKKTKLAHEISTNYTRQPPEAFLNQEKLHDMGLDVQHGSIVTRQTDAEEY